MKVVHIHNKPRIEDVKMEYTGGVHYSNAAERTY